MIVVEGWVRLPAENIEKARAAMETMITASRSESGCIDYAYSLDLTEADMVRVSERWVSREALKLHFETAHMAEWRKALAGLGITERSLRLYEADPEPM